MLHISSFTHKAPLILFQTKCLSNSFTSVQRVCQIAQQQTRASSSWGLRERLGIDSPARESCSSPHNSVNLFDNEICDELMIKRFDQTGHHEPTVDLQLFLKKALKDNEEKVAAPSLSNSIKVFD